MFASTTLSPALLRVAAAFAFLVRKFLMVAGLVFLLALAGTYSGNFALLNGLKAVLPAEVAASESLSADAADDADGALADGMTRTSEQVAGSLTPTMRRALSYVSRRYHVSNQALMPIFATAQESGRDLGLDPLLIIAVIGVESGFNPFSQSVVGAQGLMQVMPRFHADKLPEDAGELPFFDPVTNVQVGARVLRESIARNGGLERGLQQFGGAINDPDRRYAGKVLAERQRLEQAVLQMRKA